MLDYSERRPVNTANRPRKQGMARYFVLTAFGGVLAGYGLGLICGWFMFKPSRQELNALRASAEKAAASPAPASTTPAPPKPVTGPPDPNLSFYKTLPSGKAVLGTGLNPAKPENPAPAPGASLPPPAATPDSPPQPAARAAATTAPTSPERHESASPEKTAVKSPSPPALPDRPAAKPSPLTAAPAPTPAPGADQSRKAQPKGKYVVQVASYQSKSEAEAVRERLTDAGLPAYIVETVVKDKGTMYRVRVGRHLELSAAEELAGKAGRNAIAVLE